ncbi:MAG TPA: OB-fold nucleic acid binding domain-containing protein, partial [Candidatus Omnitrophota bacterium]|nr:OB-fold nucleic acid binding domain-containing protein [Candidatus Omnitrophota bacterium]
MINADFVLMPIFAGRMNKRSKGTKMEKVFIKEFKNGENIATIFILNRKEVKRTKTDKLYAEFTLIDKTGKIEARLWDNVEKYANKAETGDVVLVEGSVVEFRDEKQIKVDSLKKMSDGTFDYGDLVRVVEGRDDLFKKVSTYLSEIKNPWLKALVESFLLDTDFVKRFCDGVGAKSWHNAYIGGLLEHTYDVMTIVDKACSLYPEADRDMALFGAFLHDTGKIYELDEKKMEYTIEGGLIGHIVIGYKMLVKRMESIKDFPKDL